MFTESPLVPRHGFRGTQFQIFIHFSLVYLLNEYCSKYGEYIRTKDKVYVLVGIPEGRDTEHIQK